MSRPSFNRNTWLAAMTFIAAYIFPLTGLCQLQVAGIFSDNMVLQRDQPVHIWGKGIPGKKITISFSKETKVALVKNDSSWNVYFAKQKANQKPQSIRIKSDNVTIELKNILIGDIWLCSGQSNMEWAMSGELHWEEEKMHAENPLIRFINPPPAGRNVYGVAFNDSLLRRLTKDSFYLWNGWKTCDSTNLKTMSAVGYYFAKSITDNENIPIGLINLSIGGAPIETFISLNALQNNKRFAAKTEGDWLENNSLPQWSRQRGKQNIGGNIQVEKNNLGPNHAYKPGFAYAAGVQPILPMPIKGVIWYQGESNSLELARVQEYKDLLRLLIDEYRKGWKQPAMPFYWVQLSSIDTTNYQSHFWPQFRDEQRKLLGEVKNGGMAVSSDIGLKNNVHPTNKKEVGYRLARWALHGAYHADIVPSGPLPLHAVYVKGQLIIRFHYTSNGLKTSDGQSLKGFSVDGINESDAFFDDRKIIIPVTTKPAYVYYGWKPFSDGNLVNSENLPASTFRIKVE